MRLIQPTTWADALAAKAEYPQAAPICGGTDIMVEPNFDLRRPEVLLDLTKVEQLRDYGRDNGRIRVGAAVTYTRIIDELAGQLPGLAIASRTAGSPQIRNRATAGGNLGSSPAGDAHPPLLATGAVVEVSSVNGQRQLPVAAKVGARNAMVIAVCSFAVALHPQRHAVGTGIGSAAPTPRRAVEAEQFAAHALDEHDLWETRDALPESGFCTPGLIIAADDLLSRTPHRKTRRSGRPWPATFAAAPAYEKILAAVRLPTAFDEATSEQATTMQEYPLSDNGKIPVTVLTGFLGSGKTTLVNHILTANHGHRIAVIENEFGEIPIDDALVLTGQEQIIEMSNGCCLCCTARTDLIDILHSLLQRPERVDRVVIETSGMADPNPVAQTFFVDDVVTANYTLDAIVTLVDAKHVEEHLAEVDHNGVGAQTYDQISFADRIFINKVDLVEPEDVTRLEQRLRQINATAQISTSSYANIDLPDILGTGAFDLSRTMASNPGWLDENEHQHDPALSSVGVELRGDLDEGALRTWLSELVNHSGDDLYRLKGVVAVRDERRRFVIQGIHHLVDMQPNADWGALPRNSKVVFIGRDLDRGELTRGLESCLS